MARDYLPKKSFVTAMSWPSMLDESFVIFQYLVSEFSSQ
jgi:hypothetical protein